MSLYIAMSCVLSSTGHRLKVIILLLSDMYQCVMSYPGWHNILTQLYSQIYIRVLYHGEVIIYLYNCKVRYVSMNYTVTR